MRVRGSDSRQSCVAEFVSVDLGAWNSGEETFTVSWVLSDTCALCDHVHVVLYDETDDEVFAEDNFPCAGPAVFGTLPENDGHAFHAELELVLGDTSIADTATTGTQPQSS